MKKFFLVVMFFFCSLSLFSQSLKEKAESGDKVAQYQYAQKLSDSMFPSEEDLSEAVQWLTKSALQGYASAQSNLGYCYQVGKGVEKDYSKALHWYKKSADQGNKTAQFNIGTLYNNGNGVPMSKKNAFTWYKKSAEQDCVEAEHALAECYYYGNGTYQNKNLAFMWFRKAAEQNKPESMYYLGECYANGYGVTKSMEIAINWYEKAAEDYDKNAEYALALLYLSGDGVNKDSIVATEYLLHSASGGFCTPNKMWNCMGDRSCWNNKALDKLVELSQKTYSPNHHFFLSMLGCLYHAREDYKNAEKYYKMAINEGNVLGVIELGLMYFYISANAPGFIVPGYEEDDDVTSGDCLGLESWKMESNDSVVNYLEKKRWSETDNATYWLEKAIEHGCGDFSFGANGYTIYDHLLYAYVDGIGSERNLDRAIDVATKCLTETTSYYGVDNSYSTLALALNKKEFQTKAFRSYQIIYENLRGKQNEDYKWCYTCVLAGLGKCYYKGLGTARNYDLAFKYLQKAANNNDSESMRLLAACYRYGRGTSANKAKETEWIEKAAKCGDATAKKIKQRRNL